MLTSWSRCVRFEQIKFFVVVVVVLPKKPDASNNRFENSCCCSRIFEKPQTDAN